MNNDKIRPTFLAFISSEFAYQMRKLSVIYSVEYIINT